MCVDTRGLSTPNVTPLTLAIKLVYSALCSAITVNVFMTFGRVRNFEDS